MGEPMLFECMGICVLSPAHECEMRGSLVYLLVVKYFSSILFKLATARVEKRRRKKSVHVYVLFVESVPKPFQVMHHDVGVTPVAMSGEVVHFAVRTRL